MRTSRKNDCIGFPDQSYTSPEAILSTDIFRYNFSSENLAGEDIDDRIKEMLYHLPQPISMAWCPSSRRPSSHNISSKEGEREEQYVFDSDLDELIAQKKEYQIESVSVDEEDFLQVDNNSLIDLLDKNSLELSLKHSSEFNNSTKRFSDAHFDFPNLSSISGLEYKANSEDSTDDDEYQESYFSEDLADKENISSGSIKTEANAEAKKRGRKPQLLLQGGVTVNQCKASKWKTIRLIKSLYQVEESHPGLFARECAEQIADVLGINSAEDWKVWWDNRHSIPLKQLLDDPRMQQVIKRFVSPDYCALQSLLSTSTTNNNNSKKRRIS